ncbi:MAG: hypothetical protein ERJ67_05790 [Aphanocapsa feldmannii 277cV]|uniref:Uncharacterized protein n=1 Tax=Aphanocapsa feldmannii 277cV TaxID=2507553 RepID=A0A524RN21_9CHRO|nr:MAG: hypothetical protein ERJ67_05790 [Aphanocapsa feldmannii 277cV]
MERVGSERPAGQADSLPDGAPADEQDANGQCEEMLQIQLVVADPPDGMGKERNRVADDNLREEAAVNSQQSSGQGR